jgi:hypothetical protein
MTTGKLVMLPVSLAGCAANVLTVSNQRQNARLKHLVTCLTFLFFVLTNLIIAKSRELTKFARS